MKPRFDSICKWVRPEAGKHYLLSKDLILGKVVLDRSIKERAWEVSCLINQKHLGKYPLLEVAKDALTKYLQTPEFHEELQNENRKLEASYRL